MHRDHATAILQCCVIELEPKIFTARGAKVAMAAFALARASGIRFPSRQTVETRCL